VRRKYSLTAMAIAMAVVASLAACGNDGDKADANQNDASATTAAAPTGEPLKVFHITSVGSAQVPAQPAVRAAFEAAVESINDAGGIAGHPLEIGFCEDNADPNVSRDCAQQAIDDPAVVALVDQYSIVGGPVIDPLFEEAGLASIGMIPITPDDFSCTVCFPQTGGVLSQGIALPQFLHEQTGAEHIGLITLEVPAAQAVAEAAKAQFEATVDGGSVDLVYAPAGTTDYTSYVARMQSADVDAIAIFAGAMVATVPPTARQLGFDVPFAATAQNMGPATIDALGDLAKNFVLACGQSPLSSDVPGIKAFLADMERYAPDVEEFPTYAVEMWLAVQMFADAARSVDGEITRESVLQAMNGMTEFDSGEIIGPYSTAEPFTGLNGTVPRLFNPMVLPCEVGDDGSLSATGEFLNPFE
jgi:branched-chain amino acid transport system substrate-binding protein